MEQAVATAPVVTYRDGIDRWTVRRYYVDGEEVATVVGGNAKSWRCDPQHRHDFIGAAFGPVGEHLAGCGWVMSATAWSVQPRNWLAPTRYYGTLADAFAEAERLAERERLCSRPVAARLCRLLKRHDGPCAPWD